MKNTKNALLFLPIIFFFLCCNPEKKEAIIKGVSSGQEQPIAKDTTPRNELPYRKAGQMDENVVKEDEGATGPVADIRNEYQRIQQALQDNKLRKEVTNFTCNNDPGSGHLVRYYEGNTLVLMEKLASGSHYWEKTRVYLKNDQAFFIYEQDGSWGFGGPLNEQNPNTIDKIQEHRYYLSDGKLIRHLEKKYEDKSWEPAVTSDKVPNEIIPVQANEEYPGAAVIPQWVAGKVGC